MRWRRPCPRSIITSTSTSAGHQATVGAFRGSRAARFGRQGERVLTKSRKGKEGKR